MSSLDNIIQIERSVNIYRKADDEALEEIIINIPLETLKEIVTPNDDDPQMYEGYLLNEDQLARINALIETKIIPDFEINYYVLEATGIYDWSAN